MARCPNINSDEWKDLVAEVGEVSAYGVFIQNGYEIPVDSEGKVVSQLDRTETGWETEALALKDLSNTRRRILSALTTKFNIYEGSKKTDYIKNLKNLIEEFKEADVTRSLFLFGHNAEDNLEKLKKRMHSEPDNLQLLNQLNTFAGTYDIIENVAKFANEYLEETGGPKDARNRRIKEKIGNIQHKLKDFHDQYVKYARNAMVNRLASESTRMRHEYRLKYGAEFEENNPKSRSSLKKGEREAAKRKYIQERLNENRDKIFQEEKDYIRELLTLAPKDIDGITRSLIDQRNISDQLIQLGVKVLDRADQLAKDKFTEDQIEAVKAWEEFSKGHINPTGITDQKKLYGDILERVNGKETGFMTRPMYSSYYQSMQEMFNESRKIEDPIQRQDFIDEWKKENLINIEGSFKDVNNVVHEHRNSQWQSLQNDARRKKFYDFLIEFNQKSDEMVHGRSKLGYRLPAITKTLGEVAKDVGYKAAGKRAWSETFVLQSDDYEFGDVSKEEDIVKVMTDEKGKPLQRVVIPFRQDIKIDDQSFDLIGMALTNRYVSRNYQEKNNVKADMEILKDLLAERDIVRTKGLSGARLVRWVKQRINVSEEEEAEIEELTRKGILSDSYKLFESIVEDRLYGRSRVDAGTIRAFGKQMNINKAADFLTRWSSNNFLIANYLSAAGNALQGKVMNFLEGTRAVHYSRSNLRTAEGKYWKDLQGVLNDMGKIRPESKTNMITERFLGTSMDFSGFANHLTKDTKLKRLAGVGTLHGLNTSVEHWIQSTLTYAVLDNTKITNKNGQYIDHAGNVTSDRDKAMTMDEAFEVKDKKLVWRNDDWTVEGFDEYSPEVDFTIARKIKDIVVDLQGNYDRNNKAMLQRYWYGGLAFFLRKWVVPGFQRRFRGMQFAGKDREHLAPYMKFYSEATQEEKEGTYVSAVRFLTLLYRHGKLLQLETYSKNWNTLSDMEKANIRSAAYELLVIVASLTSSILLAGLAEGTDDEEEKQFLYTLAYWNRRLYGELAFYLPIGTSEVTRILRTPSPTLSTIELGNRTLIQLLEDLFSGEFEEYETGRRKGQIKSWVLLNKFLNPFYKNLTDKDAQESFKFLTNTRY